MVKGTKIGLCVRDYDALKSIPLVSLTNLNLLFYSRRAKQKVTIVTMTLNAAGENALLMESLDLLVTECKTSQCKSKATTFVLI